jgi:BirA family transcriptional regulator, biotin operon repressor / biotin---[acetyl-CoA-carboxylase] ligase
MTTTATTSTARLMDLLGPQARRFDVDIVAECGSTNARMLERAEAGAASGSAIVAEHQSAGRGRRGRQWISAKGDSLTFSLLWRFAPGTAPAGLSLAVGLAVARAISADFVSDASRIRLKWPNDILLDGKKLGGILVELVPGAPHAAVIGIGINLRLPEAMPDDIRAASAALSIDDGGMALLAKLLTGLLSVLEQFATGGFAPLRDDWLLWHAHQDIRVRLSADYAEPREGICRGVDVDGALLLEENGRIERVISGEVSLRGAA